MELAADLGSGTSDPRPQAPSLIARATAALPEGLSRPIIRCDSSFFDAKVAFAALANNADFAIVAKRNPATWRACREIPEDSWQKAKDMEAEVAECDYLPSSWPKGTRCVVRRVRVDRGELKADPRSRRRRTIDPNQLVLLEEGEIGFAYAYSFILTNLDWSIIEIESWFRMRALVEERIKDAKWGAALRHLPSGYESVNRTWMWCALLACNISVWLGCAHHPEDLELPGIGWWAQGRQRRQDADLRRASVGSNPRFRSARMLATRGLRRPRPART